MLLSNITNPKALIFLTGCYKQLTFVSVLLISIHSSAYNLFEGKIEAFISIEFIDRQQ